MYKGLNDYIAALEREGELTRISVAVDPVEEISELTDRESKKPGGGRALLFEDTGTPFPVITNMMGSEKRIAMALGVRRLEELSERIDALFSGLLSPKQGLMDKLAVLPLLGEVSKWLPRSRRGRGECQQVILRGEQADLGMLPVLKCWPHDGGRFITLPMVNTVDADTGARNVGMYRMQIFGPRTTGMHWHLHKTGQRHYRRYKELGLKMPVSVCLGGDPAYTYAATAPMPDNMDEYLLAGFIRRRPVELVRCVTNDLMVPADCDFVIEGYVDPAEEKVVEGPFGDHTGFYSLEDMYPLFHVTAVTHRRGAVYPATIVGIPPQEDAYIGMATERIFLSPIRMAMLPEIRDLFMPAPGVAHNIAAVNIVKSYNGQGFKVANSLWGAGQMMFNKFMVVASSGEDIRAKGVLARLLRGMAVPGGVLFGKGPLDVLDHASDIMGVGGKMLLDTTVTDSETAVPVLPEKWTLAGGIGSVDTSYADEWLALLLKCPRGTEPDVSAFLKANDIAGIKFIIIFDEMVDSSRPDDVLWIASANTDPSRDVEVNGGMIVADARIKAGGVSGFGRQWPNVVTSSPRTISLVDGRRAEYGMDDLPSSPSLHYMGLGGDDSAYYEK